MDERAGYSLVMTACGSREEAENLAASLVKNRLAACVQVTGITSFYEWKMKFTKDDEFLLLIKTKAMLYKNIEFFISRNHSYEVPEIIELPIRNGSESFFHWIDEVSI